MTLTMMTQKGATVEAAIDADRPQIVGLVHVAIGRHDEIILEAPFAGNIHDALRSVTPREGTGAARRLAYRPAIASRRDRSSSGGGEAATLPPDLRGSWRADERI